MSYTIVWNGNRNRLSVDDTTRIVAALENGFGEVELSGGRVAYLADDNENLHVKHPDTHQDSHVGALIFTPEPDETEDSGVDA